MTQAWNEVDHGARPPRAQPVTIGHSYRTTSRQGDERGTTEGSWPIGRSGVCSGACVRRVGAELLQRWARRGWEATAAVGVTGRGRATVVVDAAGLMSCNLEWGNSK